VCLTGVSSAGKDIILDGGALNRDLVLENVYGPEFVGGGL
jgi:hypothetical protein